MTTSDQPRRRPRFLTVSTAAVLAVGFAGYQSVRVEASENGVPTVFIGDSITEADTATPTDLPGRRSWLRYVVTDDRTPWRYVANEAVAGETLGEMAARFERDVLARDPRAVVIMGGTNDVRLGVDVDDSVAALASMVQRAQGAGADVWIVSPPPLERAGWGDVGDLIEAERELAEDLDVPFVDVVDSLGVGGEDRWREGYAADGVHPTRDGARALGAAVLGAVSR
ncbi:GDSL-type esterase/lipase family protein [Nocardioides zeae]|uniref:GDSL-type esterase/lipase family protein n=1 Tax=Nocardioides imazamoxiresistens TaxID=3231893 RepID=A0ABU3Q061_9ACTN|nr:GDSL-type esterase/lipase family protein [Nocardioides zeae]MDT9594779.1 GDSL-type esterase/lipase family protein [Nocardioides zeae]